MRRHPLGWCLIAVAALAACGDKGEPDPETPPDETLKPIPPHLAAAIAAAQNGGESDFDGDGMTDLVTVIEGGETTTKVVVNGRELLVVVRRADGSADKAGDYDLNGTTDFVEHEQANATMFTRTSEQDTDFDGVTDLRESYEREETAKQSHYLREVLIEDVWTVEVDRTDAGELLADGIAGCEDTQPVKDEVTTEELVGVGNITIASCVRSNDNPSGCVSADPKGACNAKEVRRIQNALVELFQDEVDALKPLEDINIADTTVIKCLKKRSPHILEGVIKHLTTGAGSRIACGISCMPGSEGNLRGITRFYDRSRIGLNMRDPNPNLVTTILHELMHSAGYDGSDDHDSETGKQDDEIYKCSQWCTGRSIKNGVPDEDDCFKCSGTKAAREECCQGKNTCSDSCCEGPCRLDGTCTHRDPCDPHTANGDFSKCIYEGATSLLGACTTSITWVFDRTDFANTVTLVPIMGNTDCTEGLMNSDCTLDPMSSDIGMGDGQLVLDYSESNPRYSGFGNTAWSIRYTCPGVPQQSVPFVSAWFAQETPTLFEAGQNIIGNMTVEDGELNWVFIPKR